MKARIFLFLFLLLIPFGLKAQDQAKITDALDDFQPEIVLEEVPIPEAPMQAETVDPSSAKKTEPLEKKTDEEAIELILEDPADSEDPQGGMDPQRMEAGAAAKDPEEAKPGKRTSVLVSGGLSGDRRSSEGDETSELIPFDPGSQMPIRPQDPVERMNGTAADGRNGEGNVSSGPQLVTEPAKALEAFLAKYQFPYSFIRVNVLKENIVSRPVDGVMQMEIPFIISFDSERYAEFQNELAAFLNGIAVSAPQELDLTKIRHSLRPFRKNVILNLQIAGERYIAFELSPECREILARYAALVPTASLALYDEGKNILSRHYFPLLYRDVVKAYPINLLGVYQGDSQTIRIYPHQEEKFAEFVHEQAASFVIPEPFTVVAAYSASEAFLNRTAKNFYLESNFRREERFPEISYMIHVQVPVEHFQSIRFMNCTVMTEQAGVPVTEAGKKKTTEFSEETLQILDENLKETDGENSILEPIQAEPDAVPSEDPLALSDESGKTETSEDRESAKSLTEPSVSLPGGVLSQKDIASKTALETAVKQALAGQSSAILSFFGEKEQNITLKKQELLSLAEAFGLKMIRKTQTFRTSPSLDLPSVGWMEIAPGISLMLLYSGTPESTVENAPANAFSQEAAFWLSLEDGSMALVSCVLDEEFVRLLNEKL
ncbi:MAG: hypothetical protein E7029_10120 [Planctomycetaceae bacterium]|nr:hypothetical protein [Planctomycetaceae bacterium]